jgi:hypothetical protein
MSLDLLTLKTLGPAAFRGSAYKWTPSGPVLRETEKKPVSTRKVLKVFKSFLRKVIKDDSVATYDTGYTTGVGYSGDGEQVFTIKSKEKKPRKMTGQAVVEIRSAEKQGYNSQRIYLKERDGQLVVVMESYEGDMEGQSKKDIAEGVLLALENVDKVGDLITMSSTFVSK